MLLSLFSLPSHSPSLSLSTTRCLAPSCHPWTLQVSGTNNQVDVERKPNLFFSLLFFFLLLSSPPRSFSFLSMMSLFLSLSIPTTLSIGVCKSPRSTRPSAYRAATCVTHVRRSACVRVITYVHGLTVFAWQYYSTPSIRGLVTLFFVGYRMLHHSIDFGRVAYAGMRFLVEYPDGGCGCMDFNKVSKKILTNLRRFSFFFFFLLEDIR